MEAMPLYSRFPSPISGEGIRPAHLIAVASALRLGQIVRLRCANHLQLFLRSSSSHDYYHSVDLHKIKESWCWRPCTFKHYYLVKALYDTVSSLCSSCHSFFSGNEPGNTYVAKHKFQLNPSTGSPLNKRLWTNIFLALNILAYVAQTATQGKLLLWGAKVNSLIYKGQLWRLITSSFLHANIGHLMVGSFSVFVLRHRSIFSGGKSELQQIVHVIAINMVIGLLSRGIDNWGHLGGLLGGAAVSWLVGPAWRCESRLDDGRLIYSDRAPIPRLLDGMKMR